jgi:NAD(P)-dependent dehydrogenase (short-subunit alcohol dehydrogenase family)
VVINGRKSETVDKVAGDIRRAAPGVKIIAVAADVSEAAGCDKLVRTAASVDILVNNAGIFEPKDFFAIPDEDWRRFFETNVMSGVRLSRAYMPRMLELNWGRIVFISSESALQIPKEMIHYSFTKTAQLAISRGLAELTAGTGVTVNSVLPGPTLSERAEEFLSAMAKEARGTIEEIGKRFIEEHRPNYLLRRFASVDEVANMVVYVSSKEASATNGAALRVDGGDVPTIA